MRLSNACISYFSGFKEIYHFKQNDNKTNALALLKIISYFTLVIPSTVAVVYAMGSLCSRISKKHSFSEIDNKVNDQAKKNGLSTTREEKNFNATFEKVKDINTIGCANFYIRTAAMKGTILELEIDQQSRKDPEIQLLQDENNKLYLAGGKIDPPTLESKTTFSLAPYHQMKVQINLSFLKDEKNITILEKTPRIMSSNEKEFVCVQEASDRPLITILNLNQCEIHHETPLSVID